MHNSCTKTDGITKSDFSNFIFPSKFDSKIYNKNLTLQEAVDNQQELEILINKLNNDYKTRNQIKINEKNGTLKPARKLFFIRENIVRAFKRGIFPYIDRFKVEKESDEESDENDEIDTSNMTDLEGEESTTERKGLKILIPNQMLSRLPTSLAQLKAGNNSQKLENKVKQFLYSLCISKKLTKQLNKSLVDII